MDFHKTWYERHLACLYTVRIQQWAEQCSITADPHPPSLTPRLWTSAKTEGQPVDATGLHWTKGKSTCFVHPCSSNIRCYRPVTPLTRSLVLVSVCLFGRQAHTVLVGRQPQGSKTWVPSPFKSRLLCPEDGGSTFRRNVGKFLRDSTDSVDRVLLEKLMVPHLDKAIPAGQSRDRYMRGCHNTSIYALLHCLFLNKPTECIWLCFIIMCSSSTVSLASVPNSQRTHTSSVLYTGFSTPYSASTCTLKGNAVWLTHSLTPTVAHTQL